MAKKGASLIFEQVMLFMVGVGIFVVSFSVFSIYQEFFVSSSSIEQLDAIKEQITNAIVEVASKDTNSSVIISIPTQASGTFYNVSLNASGLTLTDALRKTTSFSTVYNLNQQYQLSGSVPSIKGKLIINKKGTQITIL